MAYNILPQMIKCYREEGYEVSVGLNPWRERKDGSFSFLLSHDFVTQLKTNPDFYYSAKSLPLLPQAFPAREKLFLSIWKLIVESLKLNDFTKKFFKKELRLYLPRSVFVPGTKKMHYFGTGGGISVDEIYFFETILNLFKPKVGFLVGIAAGWSTIALGLISPNCKFYGIDSLTEGSEAQEGLFLTKKIVNKLNIDLSVHIGSSPIDVPAILGGLEEKVDFVFVDGLHTNKQIFLDFEAALPFVSESSIIVFHDVLNWNMLDGWNKIVEVASNNGFKSRLLRRTSSGLGVLSRNIEKETDLAIEAFCQDNRYPEVLDRSDRFDNVF